MKDVELVIEGKEYIFDLELAQKLGVLRENVAENVAIKSFQIGDVFQLPSGTKVIIVQNGYNHPWPRYNLAGRWDGLYLFSDIGEKGLTEKEMLDFLNKTNLTYPNQCTKYLMNINVDIQKLLSNL